MKQYFRVINDTHLFGVNPTHTFDQIAKAIYTSPWPVVLNGDIVDIANAPKRDLPLAYQQLILLYEMGKKHGHVVRGNHTLNRINAPDMDYIDPENKILAVHGDIPAWGKERSDLFRSQAPGAGWFKRNVISRPIDFCRRFIEVRPNAREKTWIAERQFENKGLRAIFLAHSHPKEHIFFSYAGVNCVIAKRGINDFVVDDDYQIKSLERSSEQ